MTPRLSIGAPMLIMHIADALGDRLPVGNAQSVLADIPVSYTHLNQYAQSIFAALRDADSADEQNIVVETVPEQGLGLAIMNRLKKAAAK